MKSQLIFKFMKEEGNDNSSSGDEVEQSPTHDSRVVKTVRSL